MNIEYFLIDFENVQPKDLAQLKGGNYRIRIFLGSKQAKLPAAMASALQPFGSAAEYIFINGSGKNAADFHIAYYLGQIAASVPGATLNVISKDTGFDILLKHLQEKGIRCRRSVSIAEARGVKSAPAPPSMSDRVKAVMDNLTKRKSAKPRTLKTLHSTIKALFGSQLPEDEIDPLIKELVKRALITVAE